MLHTKTANLVARRLLGSAVEIDPGYAAAHAYIAFTHVIDYVNGWSETPEQSLRTGQEIAQRSVELDDEEPMAHFALGAACLWNRELDRAKVEAERCLALAPNSAEAHLVTSHIQIYSGDAAAAVETIDTYMGLDPHYPDIVLYFLAEARISLGDYELAIAALKQRVERNPDSPTSYALLASSYGNLGRIEEGKVALAELFRIAPDFSVERRRRILPFKNPADFERRLEGFRKVGLEV